jgi:general secretion pathway protein C
VTPRQVRIGVDIFAALVVASVGVALAGLSWRLLGDPGSRLSASLMAARPARPVDIAPLIALAPFGTTAVSGAAAQTGNLPLTLRGIIFARPTTASSALISVGDATPVVVRIGQSVGSSNVGSIEIDHVVLVSGGAQTILAFPQSSGGCRDGSGNNACQAAVGGDASRRGRFFTNEWARNARTVGSGTIRRRVGDQ